MGPTANRERLSGPPFEQIDGKKSRAWQPDDKSEGQRHEQQGCDAGYKEPYAQRDRMMEARGGRSGREVWQGRRRWRLPYGLRLPLRLTAFVAKSSVRR